MIVVDTNVVARFVLRGDAAAIAERVMQRDASWVAPPLARSELRNVLATSMRARQMAKKLGVPLVASDRQVRFAFLATSVSPEAFAAN